MKSWEVKYLEPHAGGEHILTYTMEATRENEARSRFKEAYPLAEIISITEKSK